MIKLQGQNAFNVDLAAFAKQLGVSRAKVYRRTALELWNGITKRTPVDTGRARSSWNLAIGAPNPTVPAEMGIPTGKHKEKTTPPIQPKAGMPDMSKVDGEDVIYITSNLPYIEPLENGHSKQAPIGMVQITITEVVQRIQLLMGGQP